MVLTALTASYILLLRQQLEKDTAATLIRGVPSLLAGQLVCSLITSRDFFSSFLAALLSLLLSPLVTLVFVLLGAPATAYLKETLLCALYVTVLTIQPMVSRYGLELSFWRRAFALDLPITDVYAGFLGGVLGAWLGAVPIALDWDRPWQQWPITILFGASIGTLAGNLMGFVVSMSAADKYGIERQYKADEKAVKQAQAKAQARSQAQQSRR